MFAFVLLFMLTVWFEFDEFAFAAAFVFSEDWQPADESAAAVTRRAASRRPLLPVKRRITKFLPQGRVGSKETNF
jgi:hypothetical protein